MSFPIQNLYGWTYPGQNYPYSNSFSQALSATPGGGPSFPSAPQTDELYYQLQSAAKRTKLTDDRAGRTDNVNPSQFFDALNPSRHEPADAIHTQVSVEGAWTMPSDILFSFGSYMDPTPVAIRARVGMNQEVRLTGETIVGGSICSSNKALAEVQLEQIEQALADRTCKYNPSDVYRSNVFHPDLLEPVEKYVARTLPIGPVGPENDAFGGDTLTAKQNFPADRYTGYEKRNMQLSISSIISCGAGFLTCTIPQETPVGYHIWLVCMPTVLKNNTKFWTGGIDHIPQLRRHIDNRPLGYSSVKVGTHDYDCVPIYQWQFIATSQPAFNPNDIRKKGKENQGFFPNAKGYYHHVGIVQHPLAIIDPYSKPDYLRGTREFNYLKEVVGKNHMTGLWEVYFDFDGSGYF